jgi:hypothetical protein
LEGGSLKKKLAVSIMVLCFFFTTQNLGNKAVATESFSDVRLYREEIQFLKNRQVIKGYPNNQFRPDAPLKRLQAVEMILREKGWQLDKLTPADVINPNFTDMKPGEYGYPAVAKAVELGIISGKTNLLNGSKYFDPWGTLTRGQMAKILTAAYKMDLKAASTFKDVLPNHWAYLYVSSLVDYQVATGFGDHTFRPNTPLTRAHFSVFLARYLDERFRPVKGFAPNRHKKYVYQYSDGREVTALFGKNQDNYDMWIYKSLDGMYTNGIKENKAALISGIAETDMENRELIYPLQVGARWDDGYAEEAGIQVTKAITSIQRTVNTPAGTFTNAVEVRDNLGHQYYYVRGIGLVLKTKETDDGSIEIIRLKAILDPTVPTFNSVYPTQFTPQPGNVYVYRTGNGKEVVLQALETLGSDGKKIRLSGDLLGFYNGINVSFTQVNNQLLASFGNQVEPQLKFPIQNGLKWTYQMNYGGLVVNMQNVKAEIISTTTSMTTPYGTYKNLVKVKVTPPSGYDLLSGWTLSELAGLNPFEVKAVYHYYAEGIGLVKREAVVGTRTITVLELMKVE